MRFAFVTLTFALIAVGRTARAEGTDEDAEGSEEKAKGDEEKAENSTKKRIVLGAALQFVLPVGDMADETGPQLGPMVLVGGRIIPALEVAARSGYLFAFNKSTSSSSNISSEGILTSTRDSNITLIPIWLGARYFFMNAPAGLYGAAELAFNILGYNSTSSVSIGNAGVSSPYNFVHVRAGFNVGVGYVISPEVPIDIRAQFSCFNLLVGQPHENLIFGVGLSAGYSLFL